LSSRNFELSKAIEDGIKSKAENARVGATINIKTRPAALSDDALLSRVIGDKAQYITKNATIADIKPKN